MTDELPQSGDTHIHVATPWSATDFANALEKVLHLLPGLIRTGAQAANFVGRQRARGKATSIDALLFEPGGMRVPLKRIAEGDWGSADVDALETQLIETAEQVDDAIADLDDYRTTVRERFGQDGRALLDAVIAKSYDPATKPSIRGDIRYIIELCNNLDEILDENYKKSQKEFIQERAAKIIADIKMINDSIKRLHDSILPPKQRLAKQRSGTSARVKGT